MATLRLTNVCRDSLAGRERLCADFRVGWRSRKVWLRASEGPLADTANPFVAAALVPAMRRGWSIEVDGSVSAKLLEGTERIQEIITGWYPSYRRVPLKVTSEAGDRPQPGRCVASFFSGGVDSFYTLRQHREEITHLIFVHGLDIPLHRRLQRRRISSAIHELAGTMDLCLVEVETNLRQFGEAHVSWPKAYFGSVLAAVALLLAPRFAKFYLPGTLSRDQLEPMGSHPDLDPNWSDGSIELVHDGLEATRSQKLLAIADWAPVQSHLRVCYQSPAKALNCGRCRKCLWTMMLLSAGGWLERVKTFDTPLDLQALSLYPPASGQQRDRVEVALALLRHRNADPELQAVLASMLSAAGRQPLAGRVRHLVSRARTRLAHSIPWGSA